MVAAPAAAAAVIFVEDPEAIGLDCDYGWWDKLCTMNKRRRMDFVGKVGRIDHDSSIEEDEVQRLIGCKNRIADVDLSEDNKRHSDGRHNSVGATALVT